MSKTYLMSLSPIKRPFFNEPPTYKFCENQLYKNFLRISSKNFYKIFTKKFIIFTHKFYAKKIFNYALWAALRPEKGRPLVRAA